MGGRWCVIGDSAELGGELSVGAVVFDRRRRLRVQRWIGGRWMRDSSNEMGEEET
jgi:hypothetical protein